LVVLQASQSNSPWIEYELYRQREAIPPPRRARYSRICGPTEACYGKGGMNDAPIALPSVIDLLSSVTVTIVLYDFDVSLYVRYIYANLCCNKIGPWSHSTTWQAPCTLTYRFAHLLNDEARTPGYQHVSDCIGHRYVATLPCGRTEQKDMLNHWRPFTQYPP
jgi:hypothetical protein